MWKGLKMSLKYTYISLYRHTLPLNYWLHEPLKVILVVNCTYFPDMKYVEIVEFLFKCVICIALYNENPHAMLFLSGCSVLLFVFYQVEIACTHFFPHTKKNSLDRNTWLKRWSFVDSNKASQIHFLCMCSVSYGIITSIYSFEDES